MIEESGCLGQRWRVASGTRLDAVRVVYGESVADWVLISREGYGKLTISFPFQNCRGFEASSISILSASHRYSYTYAGVELRPMPVLLLLMKLMHG